MKKVQVGDAVFGDGKSLVLIAGPCVIENEAATLQLAERLRTITDEVGVKLVFKASFDKANRSSVSSYRGPGLEEGLRILARVKADFDLPVLSDVHECAQVVAAAEVLDILQIPAFLCRQTDLLVAAAKTGRPVNVKKGQFMAPGDMQNVLHKLEEGGASDLLLTERGSTFGYNNLVVDMRSLPIMRQMGVPVIFDATHAVQLPGGAGTASGGQREFVSTLSRAAVGTGIDGLFWEVHEEPDKALCDGPNSLPVGSLSNLLREVVAIDAIVKESLGD